MSERREVCDLTLKVHLPSRFHFVCMTHDHIKGGALVATWSLVNNVNVGSQHQS
jgi:hypothetical protein